MHLIWYSFAREKSGCISYGQCHYTNAHRPISIMFPIMIYHDNQGTNWSAPGLAKYNSQKTNQPILGAAEHLQLIVANSMKRQSALIFPWKELMTIIALNHFNDFALFHEYPYVGIKTAQTVLRNIYVMCTGSASQRAVHLSDKTEGEGSNIPTTTTTDENPITNTPGDCEHVY